jgi:hypothetical protein
VALEKVPCVELGRLPEIAEKELPM